MTTVYNWTPIIRDPVKNLQIDNKLQFIAVIKINTLLKTMRISSQIDFH